jgi:hypothetical protein
MTKPTHTEISALVREWLPQYADGFRMAKSGRMLLKTPEALLCRDGMLRKITETFPDVTMAQLVRATGFSDGVVRATLKRIVDKRSPLAIPTDRE